MPPTSRSTVVVPSSETCALVSACEATFLRAPGRLLGGGADLFHGDGRLRDRRGLLGGRRRVLRHRGEDLRCGRTHARGRLRDLSGHVTERLDHAIEVASQCIQLRIAAGRQPHGEVARPRALNEDLLLGDPLLHRAVGGALRVDKLLELIRHRVERPASAPASSRTRRWPGG
jgi:hypothetical protein